MKDTSMHNMNVRGVGAQRRGPIAAALVALSLTLTVAPLIAQDSRDLASLSVDDLMNVEVTSVARKGQKLSETAAAAFVITQDDIRRSGATSIPEILRMVPGLNVAQVNGSVWAISSRGSNGQFANKLLVMIDGRSVYTPLFSGVFWDTQDTMLDDIDRIEVIRGPGGTLWGANAVNGIINIITKHAIDTQGALVSVGAGDQAQSSAEARYGGSIGPNGYYRVFGKSFDRPASIGGAVPTNDAWSAGRGGFRTDWTSRRGDSFTAQADLYRGSQTTLGLFNPLDPLVDRAATDRVSGQDVQFRWTAVQSSRSDTVLQAIYDYTARSQPSFVFGRRTFDIDFQHHLKIGSRNDAVWGASYLKSDDHAGGPHLELVRRSGATNLASAFVQDEIQVARRLRATIGTKVQYDSVTQFQLQPTVRLLFQASARQTFWAAATSAVRTPSEAELYLRENVAAFPDGRGGTGLAVLNGNPDLKPERIESYEVGYRWEPIVNVALDATAFHNTMRDLVGTQQGDAFLDSSGRLIVPTNIQNIRSGHTNGAEFLLTDSVVTNWNVAIGYAFLQSSASLGDVSSPRHQLQLRSFIQLPRQFEVDSSAYYVGALGQDISSYVRLDAQLSWHPSSRWTLSIAGQNLLRSRHSEFAGINGEVDLGTPVQRTVNGKVVWRF